MESFSLLEIIGTIIGIAYLVLEYRASVWLWPVGVVMPAIYIYIYHQAGIYADMGISIYFLAAAIYGWIVWASSKQKASGEEQGESSEMKIVRTTPKEWAWCSAIFLATFAALCYVLINYTSSTVPYSDSFTTALSIIGMWMLAHKRVEHWILWIIVDAVSSAMYIEKGLYPTAALYTLYTIIAVAGYIKWCKMMMVSEGGAEI